MADNNAKSKDFIELMRLLYKEGASIKSVNIKVSNGNNETTSIKLETKDGEKAIVSEESDVAMFAFSINQATDAFGDLTLRSYKNIEKMYDDIQFLLDPDKQKLKNAVDSLTQNKFHFRYNPEELLTQFLDGADRTRKKYLPLKKDYYEILGYFLLTSGQAVELKNNKEKSTHNFTKYYSLTDYLLRYFRKGPNLIKDYCIFRKYLSFDIKDITTKTTEEFKHLNDLISMLALRNGVKGEVGVKYALDTYRRLAEISSRPINFLRIALELDKGIEEPELFKSFAENCRILKQDNRYKDLVEIIDPLIRHSESHTGTEIDSENMKVLITRTKNKKKEILKEYTYQEICNFTNEIQEALPAILVSFLMYELAMIVLILNSKEYLIALVGVDNRRN